MLDQILSFIPAHEAQLLALFGACATALSLLFGLSARTIWLSKVFGSVSPADLIRLWKYLRLGLTWFAQWRATRKIIGGAILFTIVFALQGCAASFEESTGKITTLPSARTATPEVCATISSRAKWESALAKGGAFLTGATGLSAIPIESRNGRMGIAVGSLVAATGTVLVLALWESDASEYLAQGCGTLAKGAKKL